MEESNGVSDSLEEKIAYYKRNNAAWPKREKNCHFRIIFIPSSNVEITSNNYPCSITPVQSTWSVGVEARLGKNDQFPFMKTTNQPNGS